MRKLRLQQGFTMVEILVVVVIIIILATITYVAYNGYQNQASSSQATTLIKIIASAEDRYYDSNGEYPDRRTLTGSGVDGTTMTDYTVPSQALNIETGNFQQKAWSFAPCITSSGGDCTISDATSAGKIYYLARDATVTTSKVFTLSYGVSTCSVTFPAATGAADSGASAFVMAFRDPSNTSAKWTLYKSKNGLATTSNTTNCPMTSL